MRKGAEKTAVRKKPETRFTTLKVRLYPNREQAALLEKTFGCCRWIWNHMLEDQERFYLETGAFFLPTPAKYKNEAPFLREVDSQALIQEHNRLAQAFRNFFRQPESFRRPRFKRKKDGHDSFTACSHDFPSGPTLYITREGIRMTKLGIVPAKFHRRPLGWWKLRRITVKRSPTGKYYGCLLYECPEKPGCGKEEAVPVPERTAGLKYSASRLYVMDTGAAGELPGWLAESQEKLSALQRSLCGKERGSRRYRETVQKIRLIHEHIANQRRDLIHKESHRIANEWDAVCVRGDRVEEMAKGMPLVRPAASGWGMFRECLRYKLARQGKRFLEVGRYYPSTRTCSRCGAVREEPVDRRARTWVCPRCGAVLEREVNAARNIKAQGLAGLC